MNRLVTFGVIATDESSVAPSDLAVNPDGRVLSQAFSDDAALSQLETLHS
jgi:hypothetical protein